MKNKIILVLVLIIFGLLIFIFTPSSDNFEKNLACAKFLPEIQAKAEREFPKFVVIPEVFYSQKSDSCIHTEETIEISADKTKVGLVTYSIKNIFTGESLYVGSDLLNPDAEVEFAKIVSDLKN